jgi:hypothetical protein
MRGWISWLYVAAALLPAAAMAQAPVPPVQHAARAQERPALAVGAALDAEGRLWLARMENRLLTVSHSADGGRSFSAPVAVTPQPEAVTAEAENRPKLAVDADGTVHVTWTQNLGPPMTGHIRYARSTDGGRGFTPPITLNDDRRIISHRFDALTSDGRGRVAVVWLDARGRSDKTGKKSPQTDVGVYAALSQDGGASFAPNRQVAEHSCQCCRTGLAWTQHGPIAFWRHVFGRNIRDFAIARLDGGPVLRVTDDEWEIDGCPHHGGGIAVDGRGNLHIVWFNDGARRKGIFHRRIAGTDFSKSDARLDMSDPLALGDPARQAGHPAVAASGERVLLAWREFDGQRFSAWTLLSPDAGASWGAPQKLAESEGPADYALPLLDARQARVVWNTAADGLRVIEVRP